MPNKPGGQADKSGNRYEYNWVINKMLEVLMERKKYLIYEPIGEWEKGVDVWIGNNDGTREAQQCKARNAAKDDWDLYTLKHKGIIESWGKHLKNDDNNFVALISPLPCTNLEDLISRAVNFDGDSKAFIEHQINGSAKEFQTFFKNLCTSLALDFSSEDDIGILINLLRRMRFRQFPDSDAVDYVKNLIPFLFSGDVNSNYAKLLDIVINSAIWGRKLGIGDLTALVNEKGLVFNILAKDSRIMPRIGQLNEEFREVFQPISGKIFSSKSAKSCIDNLLTKTKIAIHGNAGVGKSGCVENIISFCEDNHISYLAIKLDKRYPNGFSDKWGEEMGLPASPAKCLAAVSADKKCVLILDQLDALRWTHANSVVAVEVCKETIKEVDCLNRDRNEKITVVVVCRTYDLTNDKDINRIVNEEWIKIPVTELDENERRNLVDGYDYLPKAVRELLRLPSNVFIWNQLSKTKKQGVIRTSFHLIECWWQEICEQAVNRVSCSSCAKALVEFCKAKGVIAVPKHGVEMDIEAIKYLISRHFIVEESSNYSFVHQSILDYFLAKDLFEQFLDCKEVDTIIGSKDKQTPGRRYQVQQSLQLLSEESVNTFIDVSDKILSSESVRFSYKYIFIELLASFTCPSEIVCNYVLSMVDSTIWQMQFRYEIFVKNPEYLRFLLRNGRIDEWEKENGHTDIVNLCLKNMAPDYNLDETAYLEKQIQKCPGYDWNSCFISDIFEDSDAFYELKLKYFNLHPDIFDRYISLQENMKKCDVRTVRFLAAILNYSGQLRNKQIIQFEEEYINYESDIIVNSYKEVADVLKPAIIEWVRAEEGGNFYRSTYYKYSVARACIEILKKALRMLACNQPIQYINEYLKNTNQYFGRYQKEIILYSLLGLSEDYSDEVIVFIVDNMDMCVEETSRENNSLTYAKCIVSKYAEKCDADNFRRLEDSIIRFRDKYVEQSLHNRIEYKHTNHISPYWRFWGYFQHDMLLAIPCQRLSVEALGLLKVFSRDSRPFTFYSRGGEVESTTYFSAFGNKNLPMRAWYNIIKKGRNGYYKSADDGKKINSLYPGNKLFGLLQSFEKAVKGSPKAFLDMMVENANCIKEEYVDAFWEALAADEVRLSLSIADYERMISEFSYECDGYRALCICRVLYRIDISNSAILIGVLEKLLASYTDSEPKGYDLLGDNSDDSSYVTTHQHVYNSVRSYAAMALANAIKNNNSIVERNKPIIDSMSKNNDDVLRLSSLYLLCAIMDTEKSWATKRIINVYKSNPKLLGYERTRELLREIYKRKPLTVCKIVKLGCDSKDSFVEERMAALMAELYMIYNRFSRTIFSVNRLGKEKCKTIGVCAGYYLHDEKASVRARKILYRYLKHPNVCVDDHIWSNLFYNNLIDEKEDRELISNILRSKANRQVLFSFEKFIDGDIIPYAEDIVVMAEDILKAYPDNENLDFGWERELSRAVFVLYDGAIKAGKYDISEKCLDLLDLMFEKGINEARRLSRIIMER